MDCIFCKIARGDIPAKVAYQDDQIMAFHDLNPMAPVHVLVIPRRHIASVNEVTVQDRDVLGGLFVAAREIAAAQRIADTGYRMVMNAGSDAGQSVAHVHLHVLGGRSMQWPPG